MQNFKFIAEETGFCLALSETLKTHQPLMYQNWFYRSTDTDTGRFSRDKAHMIPSIDIGAEKQFLNVNFFIINLSMCFECSIRRPIEYIQ